MSLKSKFLIWFMQTWIYKQLATHVFPHLRFPAWAVKGCKDLTGRQFRLLHNAMQNGDWIFTVEYRYLSSRSVMKITGGEVSHCLQCVQKDHPTWELGEMTHDNYTKNTLANVWRKADRIIIVDKASWSPSYRKEMAFKNMTYVNAKYDLGFDIDENGKTPGVPFLACSELLYHSDFKRTVPVDLKDYAGIGRPYISPQGLLNGQGLRIKADTDTM